MLTQRRRQNAVFLFNWPMRLHFNYDYDLKYPREFGFTDEYTSKLANCLHTVFLMIYSVFVRVSTALFCPENFLRLNIFLSFISISTVYPILQLFFLSFCCFFHIKSIYGHLHEWLTMTLRHYITISFYLSSIKSRVRANVPRGKRGIFWARWIGKKYNILSLPSALQ